MRVHLSIHGHDAETHEAFTGVDGSFEQVLKAVRLLRSKNINTMLKCTVTRLNQEHIKDIKKIGDELGVYVLFDTVVQVKNDGDRKPLDLAVSTEFRKRFWSEEFNEITEGGGLEPIDWSDVEHICGAGKSSVLIDPYGTVFPCPVWRKPLGNLKKNSFREIMDDSPAVEEVLDATREVVRRLKKIPYGGFCNFCPGSAYHEKGSVRIPCDQAKDNAMVRQELRKADSSSEMKNNEKNT